MSKDLAATLQAAAFPLTVRTEENSYATGTGLTKRELFAAMAVQGMLSNSETACDPTNVARWALKQADALIAALREA